MIEDTMRSAAETMRQAAEEIVKLRTQREMLAQALRDIEKHQSIVCGSLAEFSTIAQIARRALASLEQQS